jgi:hypothetical protein
VGDLAHYLVDVLADPNPLVVTDEGFAVVGEVAVEEALAAEVLVAVVVVGEAVVGEAVAEVAAMVVEDYMQR